MVPAIFGPWAPRVLDLAAPAAGERVLDAACGTGVVARLAAQRVGSEGRVVCCQLGLQFFPDRPAALAEMARVLVAGGRLAAMVWQSIDRSPGFAVLAEALDRHVGPAAGAILRAPFGLGDETALRSLVVGPGSGRWWWTGRQGWSGRIGA